MPVIRYTIGKQIQTNFMENITTPKTLLEAVNYFSNDAICVAYLEKIFWADGKPHCPKCGSDNVSRLKFRPAYRCREKGCKKSFSLKTNTIMINSPLPITKWVPAIWFVINHKNGVSSCEVARALGICQKSAWHLCHRIRKAVSNGSFTKMSGVIEADETFVGGKTKFMHADRKALLPKKNRRIHGDKTVVMGILERGNEVRAKVVNNQRRANLLPELLNNVEEGSTVYTDKLRSYDVLPKFFTHETVDHAKGEYTRGEAHTNGMENFWSCFKRSVKGTYIQIASFHTDRYLDEQSFRFNYRKLNDAQRFEIAVGKIFGKSLPYDVLIGKVAI